MPSPLTRKRRAAQTALVERRRQSRPHAALGHSAGNEQLWENCRLNKLLVSERELNPLATPLPRTEIVATEHTEDELLTAEVATKHVRPADIPDGSEAFGISATEKKMIFQTLPEVTATYGYGTMNAEELSDPAVVEQVRLKMARQQRASDAVARILHLSNTNAQGIHFENRRRIVRAFSSTGTDENDTGRTEVQGSSDLDSLHRSMG